MTELEAFEFFEKVKDKRIKVWHWNDGRFFIPRKMEEFDYQYQMNGSYCDNNGKIKENCNFYINSGFEHDWILLDSIKETKAIDNKCKCEIRDLLLNGCKCGGI